MLVDSSVWVDHLRRGNARLVRALDAGTVWCHPFVVGELACGRLKRRDEILSLLGSLAKAPVVDHDEALAFLDAQALAGTGLGWIDVHLLASARLAGIGLWTLDRALERAADNLGVLSESDG
jgi:predicted nucleic acid-binding protein